MMAAPPPGQHPSNGVAIPPAAAGLPAADCLPEGLLALIHDQLARKDRQGRVVAVEQTGRRFWAKLAIPGKARGWHLLQKILARLIPLKILHPTVSPGGGQALRAEAARLERLRWAGFAAPEVLLCHDDFMVMADAGTTLHHPVASEVERQKQREMLARAATTLAQLHQAGLCHGRPHVKDLFAAPDGRIGFLDLEEDPATVMPLAVAQARDAWIFIASLSELLPEETLRQPILTAYLAAAPRQTRQELATLVKYAAPLCRLLVRLPFTPGTDLGRAMSACHLLQQALTQEKKG